MNRVLYQLSYAAMQFLPKSALLLYTDCPHLSREFSVFFRIFLAMLFCEVVLMRFWKAVLFFCIGGSAYVGLELLWRGRSHYSMFLAGGTCFLLLGRLKAALHRVPWLLQGIVGAGVITTVELAAGLLANRDHAVWDYRELPMNLWGQICLPFSLLWIPVSLGAMFLYEKANALIQLKKRSPEA